MRTVRAKSLLFWLVIIIAFSVRILLSPNHVEAKDKGLIWAAMGEAEGKYEESYYKIEKEVKGDTYEYAEYIYTTRKNRSLIPSSQGSSESFFLHYTLFDVEAHDYQSRKHELNFTEIIPYWSRGFTYTIHLSDELDLISSLDLFLGLGFITFEKKIENVGTYDYKFGYDLSYGWSGQTAFKWDDLFFLGVRSLSKRNKITLDFGSEEHYGYLTHRRDILVFVGYTLSGREVDCRPTKYVACD